MIFEIQFIIAFEVRHDSARSLELKNIFKFT